MKKNVIKLNEGILSQRIQNRADEIISQGYEFGQIEPDATWERCLDGGPYSDMYIAAEQLAEEYDIDIETAFNYLKLAFEQYEPIYEAKHKQTNKNIIKLNETQLRKIVAESVRRVLKEYGGTPQTLGSVAQNVSRRTDQMNSVYNTTLSNGQERGKAVGNLFNSQQYLAKAIQNAIANGMTEEEIQQVLQQNLGSNYNPQFKHGTLYWGRK